MKKVLVLACAAFFSGQLMAQTTKKAIEAEPAQATEVRAKAADAVPVKTPVPSPVANTAVAETAPVAATAIKDTKIVVAPKETELSKIAPAPSLAKPEPIKE